MHYQKYLAPAKINLCLHVNGKRSDGYHELAMIMQSVSLYDELEVAIVANPGVSFHCETVLGNHDDNLVVRAARAILAYDELGRGVDLVLRKKIPVAAGLGGGSSDAATTIMALNQLLELDLAPEILHKEALALGADVPFFLYQPVAWACGIGDKLSPVEIVPPFWIVLVNPGVGVSTAQVYRALASVDYSNCLMPKIITTQDGLVSLLHNDLERVAMNLCAEIGTLKSSFVELNADGVLMSGSGATVFGVFFSYDQAQTAAKKFVDEYGYWSQVVSPITS